MTPTERANELQPQVRDVLARIEKAVRPNTPFEPATSDRIFRIVSSDYSESTLMPSLLKRLRDEAPDVRLDLMPPSDANFEDVEQGKVDMVINRFDTMPQSFHQKTVWKDSFSCLISIKNPILDHFDLDSYSDAKHVWVSKTGWGVGVGVNPHDVQRLGWVDAALSRLNHKRRITVFTRHYQAAMLLAERKDLIVTLPSKAARMQRNNPNVVIKEPPFDIPPFELKMAWSPLLQNSPAHRWMRRLVMEVARQVDSIP